PAGKRNLLIAAPPKLLVSTPMLELLLPILPLATTWTDSLSVLQINLANHHLTPAELAVVGEEDILVDAGASRPTWVVTLRTDTQHALFWVEKVTGTTLRILQPVPPDVGSELEYRIRMDTGASPPVR